VKLEYPDFTFGHRSGVNRSFVHKRMPCGELNDAVISHVVKDPSEFYIRLKKEASAFRSLRDSLILHKLNPFEGVPQPGSLCIALSSKDNFFHRGMTTATTEVGFIHFLLLFSLIPESNNFSSKVSYLTSQMILRHSQCFATCLCLT
jgi:hypothetical protein